MTRLGVEMEMVVARRRDGASHPVGPLFSRLCRRKAGRGEPARLLAVDGRDLAVRAPLVSSSVDNAFNNLESAIGPVGDDGDATALHRIEALMRRELADVGAALAEEDAVVLNASQHPATHVDEAFYHAVRAPRPIYDYWVGHRGWRHSVGADAKAQNGPTTAVPVENAVVALNVVLAASPAFIAFFGNSPLEDGRPTGLKETRLTIWPRMFATARWPDDARLCRLPPKPFTGLRDYLHWMFGGVSRMQAVPRSFGRDYKDRKDLLRVEGDPALLDFLAMPSWRARRLDDGGAVTVRPSLRHLEFLQFSQFLDARIRYGFAAEADVDAFHRAWSRDGGIEELFGRIAAFCYIEGRAPGANFADAELAETAGEAVAASVLPAPSALQAGLLRDPGRVWRRLRRHDWRALAALREAAIRDGIAGEADGLRLRDLCAEVLDLAAAGLRPDERWMLAYPEHVLRMARNGADRTVALFERLGGGVEALRGLTERRHAVVPPPAPPALGRLPARPAAALSASGAA